jgi:hypothetical protein
MKKKAALKKTMITKRFLFLSPFLCFAHSFALPIPLLSPFLCLARSFA